MRMFKSIKQKTTQGLIKKMLIFILKNVDIEPNTIEEIVSSKTKNK